LYEWRDPETTYELPFSLGEAAELHSAHRDWIEEALKREMVARESRWSEAVAVGGTWRLFQS
jgi:hypothetical protein